MTRDWSRAPPALKPDVHREAVAVAGTGRAEARGLVLGDQQGRAADGDGVEDVVALGAGKPLDGAGEAVLREQAAALGVAVRLALLGKHRSAAVHAGKGELGMRLVDDPLEPGSRAQQLVDLTHLGKQMEGLLVDADTQPLADGVGLCMRRPTEARPAGRWKGRARFAWKMLARLDFAGARRPGDVDEADRHVDGQNGKTLAGFCEGLHDVYREDAVVVAPADDPAGATAVGAAYHHVAILALRLVSRVARKSSVFRKG